jgi:hypothetical protein
VRYGGLFSESLERGLLGIVSGFAKGKTGLNLEECGRAFRVRYGGLFSESLEHVRFQWSLDRCT